MSSVLRAPKQTPSNFFWSHGADLWSLDNIKAVFSGLVKVETNPVNNTSYTGNKPEYRGSMILFATEAEFAAATYQLLNNSVNTYYADGYNTCVDMGKNIYIGVAGGESKMLTMSLVKIQGTNADGARVGYGLTAMNLSDYSLNVYDGDIEVDLIRGGV